MLTEESLSDSNTLDVDNDQESVMNPCTVKGSSMNIDVSCVVHNDTLSSSANNQNQDLANTKDDISTSNDPAVSMLDNSNVAFAMSTNGSNFNHQRSVGNISQNGKTKYNVVSTYKNFSEGKQYRSTSVNLTKRKTLCCKMSIVFAVLFTIGCCLTPIIIYYANLAGNNVPIDPEYSQERNTSRAKVYSYISEYHHIR